MRDVARRQRAGLKSFVPSFDTPQRSAARATASRTRRFAHDLSGVPVTARVQRAPAAALESTEPVMSNEEGGRDAELETLLAEIVAQTQQNAELRRQLDALPQTSSAERDALAAKLDDGRMALMPLLQQRIALLNPEIGDLSIEVTGVGLASRDREPWNDFLGNKLNRYERELSLHERQLAQLTRWQTRKQIESLNEQIAQLDFQIAALPPLSDPAVPLSYLLFAIRDDLSAQRDSLGKSLTANALEYKQGDARWGGITYGPTSAYSTIKEGGCGPTSLAILLNTVYAEDPEAIAPASIEFVTPDKAAAYASTHGRVLDNGTNSVTMVTQVPTQWPGCMGRSVTLEQAAGELRSGHLILFSCSGCSGKRTDGKARKYDAHIMVLSGVDDSGETFNALDPGSAEGKDIETITKTELRKHGSRYWVIERK